MNLISNQQQIDQFARHWIEAWNKHDLEEIISHYADNLTFISPLIVERFDRPNGTIKSREELKTYFKMGLDSNPNLHFELVQILYSVKGFTLYYNNARGGKTAEYFELNTDGKVILVINSYSI